MQVSMQIALLERKSLVELQALWQKYFDVKPFSLNKEFYVSRIAYNGADVHNIVQDIGQAFQYFEPATVHEFITEVVEKVIVYTDHIIIKLRPMSADLFERGAIEKDSHYNEKLLELSYPIKFGRKRGCVQIVEPNQPSGETCERDMKLYNAVTQAFYYKQVMDDQKISLSELSKREKLDRGYMGQILRLTTLAPDIIMAIIEGRQPKLLTARRLIRDHFPYSWEDQRRELGFIRKGNKASARQALSILMPKRLCRALNTQALSEAKTVCGLLFRPMQSRKKHAVNA